MFCRDVDCFVMVPAPSYDTVYITTSCLTFSSVPINFPPSPNTVIGGPTTYQTQFTPNYTSAGEQSKYLNWAFRVVGRTAVLAYGDMFYPSGPGVFTTIPSAECLIDTQWDTTGTSSQRTQFNSQHVCAWTLCGWLP